MSNITITRSDTITTLVTSPIVQSSQSCVADPAGVYSIYPNESCVIQVTFTQTATTNCNINTTPSSQLIDRSLSVDISDGTTLTQTINGYLTALGSAAQFALLSNSAYNNNANGATQITSGNLGYKSILSGMYTLSSGSIYSNTDAFTSYAFSDIGAFEDNLKNATCSITTNVGTTSNTFSNITLGNYYTCVTNFSGRQINLSVSSTPDSNAYAVIIKKTCGSSENLSCTVTIDNFSTSITPVNLYLYVDSATPLTINNTTSNVNAYILTTADVTFSSNITQVTGGIFTTGSTQLEGNTLSN